MKTEQRKSHKVREWYCKLNKVSAFVPVTVKVAREVENGGWEILEEVVVTEMKKQESDRIEGLRAKVEEKSLKWHVTRTWPIYRLF
jgi:hypothetical protein